MKKAPSKSQQQQVMDRIPEDLRELFKGLLSDDPNTCKRAKNKLSRWLWENPKIGTIVKRNFSQINFGDSREFYDDSLQETFLRFDYIIQAFLRKNQFTFERLDNISEQELSNFLIRYFNRAHYNQACDLYQKWQRKIQIDGQIIVIVSIDQPKNDADGQEYSTVGETIEDDKNLNDLNDLNDLNFGDFSQEAIDKLPRIIGDSSKAIDKLRNCARNVDCLEILLLKCQGYKETEIAKKLGIHQSNVNRNWNNNCLRCIKQIMAENNLE